MLEDLAARFQCQRQLHVAILVFPDVEVLDFAGPFEVFSVAARIHAARLGTAPFRVSLVGPGGPVRARHGLDVLPHLTYEQARDVDLLIVPGGVVTNLLQDDAALRWVAGQAAHAALTASVCTGAFVLAQLGMLDGLEVTTHWEDADELQQRYPAVKVVRGRRYVDHGRIATSAGISAGIDMSLHLVGRVLGPASAQATAHQMEYEIRCENVINELSMTSMFAQSLL